MVFVSPFYLKPFLHNLSRFRNERRGTEQDTQDVNWVLTHYWQSVNINRIPEDEMERFVVQYPAVAPAWTAIKERFGA